MEETLHSFVQGLPAWALGLMIAFLLAVIGKAADSLVEESVTLSQKAKIPKAIVGATIVSLGTTLPEAVVSVLAALNGSPDLALGNAVGSIICDTGLILGIVILISPVKLDRSIVNRQGWIQLAAGALLVLGAFPYSHPASVFSLGGNLPQGLGLVFLLLLGIYIFKSVQWGAQSKSEEFAPIEGGSSPTVTTIKLTLAIACVVLSSWALIPAVQEAALRLDVPEGIIAATLVAFGTSLPELVTGVTAALKGHGELALGNVIGADILNVLFVAGSAAAVTAGGLEAPSHFFRILFPAMMMVLIVFRIGVISSGDVIRRPFGVVLLGTYLVATIMSYTI